MAQNAANDGGGAGNRTRLPANQTHPKTTNGFAHNSPRTAADHCADVVRPVPPNSERSQEVGDRFTDRKRSWVRSGVTAGGKPSAPYKRSDAGRARGWAKRIREGWKPAEHSAGHDDQSQPQDYGGAEAPVDDLPF